MIDLSTAILAINSEAKFSINGEDVNQITWYNNTTPISVNDIEAKQTELQAEYDAKQYQRDREVAYPTIQEQLDMQYWDNVNGTTTWKDAIAKVKSDNPKE
jgi:hypothetical protein|tara:strand:+ start:208 stop:510 length:303 start_codon:yes stop_codon:yes gene_type:complete